MFVIKDLLVEISDLCDCYFRAMVDLAYLAYDKCFWTVLHGHNELAIFVYMYSFGVNIRISFLSRFVEKH